MNTTRPLVYQPLPTTQPATGCGDAHGIIALPQPDLQSGLPLFAALSHRASTRRFADTPLSLRTLGELLWAANGVNRIVDGGRTAPSAHACHEIDIYAALPQGVYRYDPLLHHLVLRHAVDARQMTGYQDFVGKAPLDLVYVVRTSRLIDVSAQQRDTFAAVAIGAISQNVSLYCASAGLATVVRGWINHRMLADALSLNDDELPVLAQTVGQHTAT